MSITGEIDGEPQKVGVPIADVMSGMFAAVAVAAALRHAALTGQGQYIDIGMLDAQVAWLVNAGMNYLHGGDLGRLGNAHPNIVPYQVFSTADGYIVVAIGNDGQFRRFCDSIGRADVHRDARFATNDARGAQPRGVHRPATAGLRGAELRRLARRARGAGHRLRADQRPGPGLRRPACASARGWSPKSPTRRWAARRPG